MKNDSPESWIGTKHLSDYINNITSYNTSKWLEQSSVFKYYISTDEGKGPILDHLEEASLSY